MADYQLTSTDVVIRVDGAAIPSGADNRDRAEYEAWVAAGGVPDPYVPPPPPPQSILPAELMAQFTVDDATRIQAAVNGNAQFWLLWSAMQAQSDPMLVGNARFLQGWGALTQVLGADRVSAIAKALKVTVG